jgi:hypothetical protein
LNEAWRIVALTGASPMLARIDAALEDLQGRTSSRTSDRYRSAAMLGRKV